MKRLVIPFFMYIVSMMAMAQQVADYQVVPLPKSIEKQNGKSFVLDASVKIWYQTLEGKRNAEFLKDYVKEVVGVTLETTSQKPDKERCISLGINADITNPEGYEITVSEKSIKITGASQAGIFYAVQTLRKSLPSYNCTSVTFPTIVIKDEPRYGYRGMMLDCGRHFFSLDFVKEYIDLIALHGMNTFHWHLTDDQGWRLEIKRYPRLTDFGSKRTGTVIGNNSDVDDRIPYGGYYTQNEVREVIAYAAERYITIVPEIDMPGHSMAVLACYPELGCTGGPYEVGHRWGVYNDVLCVGNPQSYEFVKNVLDEVAELFPSDIIHIGGDETPTLRWDNCPKCQALQLNGETLQGHFTHEIADYLATKGKRIIGWDELLESRVSTSTTIMSWRGQAPGIQAAEAGYDVVMTPLTHSYFDYYQTKENVYEPSITGMMPIDTEKVYSLEPTPDSLSVAAKAHIKGVQANLWTEYIPYPQVAEYMVLPRMAALAEVAWLPAEQKDFANFKTRLERLVKYYDLKGWTYAKHLWPERMNQDRWHN